MRQFKHARDVSSSTSAMEIELDAQENLKIVTEALELVDTHFRTILSLEEIVVEVQVSFVSAEPFIYIQSI